MTTWLKSSALVVAVAAAFALSSGEANALTDYQCYQQYEACLANGGDPYDCEVQYWTCRGMPVPAKATAIQSIGNRIE